jgi:hypothetical protein
VSKKKVGYGDQDPFAISSAIDVMSFTHDIPLAVDTSAPSNIPKPPTIDPSKPMPIHAPTAPTTPAKPQGTLVKRHTVPYINEPVPKDFKDPLRELIIITEEPPEDEQTLLLSVKTLARDATLLDHFEEINLEHHIIEEIVVPAPAVQVDTMNIFQNPKDIIDPEKERAFLKTLEALEDTDSEAAEKPVLGKISLIRRAKSAVNRTSSSKRKGNQHPLFHIAWDDKVRM